MMMKRIGFILCVSWYAIAAFAEEPIVRMESRTFPDPLVWDSNYTACFVASDARVYVGLNHHGAGGTVAVYDPATDRMSTLGDMNRLVGQTNVWVEPQAKVHAQIGEGLDGKIYFGTHLSAFYGFAKFTSGEAYPGGHWMVYDPATDRVTDLGIGRKGNGFLTMTIDAERGRLYGVTYPQAHFLYYDIATGRTTDLGQVQNWDAIGRTLALDDRGRVFGPWGRGRLWRYDPDTDTVDNLQVRLPQREVGVPVHRAYWETEQTFTAVAHSPDRKKIYFLETGTSYLVEYDPHRGPEGEMRRLAQLSADRYLDERAVPYAMLSFTRGPDNIIYYATNAAIGDELGNPYWGGGMSAGLVTYDLNTETRREHGLIRTKEDDRVLVHPNSAAAAPDGTIYFVGHVLEPDGSGRELSGLPADLVLEQEPEHKKQLYRQRYTMRLLIHRPAAGSGS